MSKQSPSKQEYSSSQQLDESLSALMDGEASEMELRRILKSSDADKESIDKRWMRYHLASDAMRGEVELPSVMDLSSSISAAIADEPVYSVAKKKSVRVVGNQAPSDQQQKPIVINEATQEQLKKMEGEVNRLMLEHAQDGSQNTQQGVLPYVRVPDTEQ